MSLEIACQEYVQSGCKDGDFILVAVTEQLQSGETHNKVDLLLQDCFKNVLINLGWDILSILTPHLSPVDDDIIWKLVYKITDVGSPKEMCLAVQEQMDTLSSSDKLATMFTMLQPLQNILLRISNKAVVSSSLHSVFRLLRVHSPQLQLTQTDEETLKKHEVQSDSVEEAVIKTRQIDDGNSLETVTCVSHDKDLRSCDENSSTIEETVPNFLTVANQVLDFIRPFVDDIHQRATRPNVLYPTKHSSSQVNGPSPFQWSEQQTECLAILLCLLDIPLVSCSLTLDKKGEKHTQTEIRSIAGAIMSSIVKCHCGCVQLLTHSHHPSPSTPSLESSENTERSLPGVGLACFAYLLMVEELEVSYLPAVLSSHYLLSICTKHVVTLLERSEHPVILKGLCLLEKVLVCVWRHSLTLEALEDGGYIRLASVLTGVMVTCAHKTARQKSVFLLLKLVNVFDPIGRQKMYMSLLHSVSHAGVIGLLIHSIKNEVDDALKGLPDTDSPFLGDKLAPILKKIFTASSDTNLLEDIDRVMSSLNFLRYLLIRDSSHINKTGVWNIKVHLQNNFVSSVRQLLTANKMYCKQELETKVNKDHISESSNGPDATIEVLGEKLPKLSDKEELEMLHLARNQMDMMESVLVRVEELLEL